MRVATIFAWGLLGASLSASAEISLNIGINVGGYPDLVAVPDYPVYYAPQLDSNLFFYDGLYWVFAGDRWYSSSWYNGPWGIIERDDVPMFVLRIPVRYYRRPPAYFAGWGPDAPPRWGMHWGRDWERDHRGWDHWDRASAPRPAPLPVYQRDYSGNRYPRAEQQRAIRDNNYHYTPRDSGRAEHNLQQNARPASEQRPARGGGPDRPAPGVDARRPTDRPPADHASDRNRPDASPAARQSGPGSVRTERSRAAPTPEPQDQRSTRTPAARSAPARAAEEVARRAPPAASPPQPARPAAEPRKDQPEQRGAQRGPPPPRAREQADKANGRDERAHDERREPDRGARSADSPPHR